MNNIIQLNTLALDNGVIVKRGGGGNSGGGGDTKRWTGHADVEGLKAIGWTDEDIAYYQANGVNWNEEDDEYHKVSDDNKALYGVLTANNISTYKDRIVYLPKIDTSEVTNMEQMFYECYSLVSIPQLDTSKVMSMYSMFLGCHSLVTIPQLDTSNVTDMGSMFVNCYSLVSIPQIDTAKVTSMQDMFSSCYSLVSIPRLDTSKVMLNGSAIKYCYSLVYIQELDSKGSYQDWDISDCYSVRFLYIKNLKKSCKLKSSPLLHKESLLYVINNEAATSVITITLHSYAYERLANDADVVAALANHPNISLASN